MRHSCLLFHKEENDAIWNFQLIPQSRHSLCYHQAWAFFVTSTRFRFHPFPRGDKSGVTFAVCLFRSFVDTMVYPPQYPDRHTGDGLPEKKNSVTGFGSIASSLMLPLLSPFFPSRAIPPRSSARRSSVGKAIWRS